MKHTQLICYDCDEVVAEVDHIITLTALAAMCHSANPHTDHQLGIISDAHQAPLFLCEIECIQEPRCNKPDAIERRASYMIPWWMLGATTLVFHAAHEAHRLRVNYNGIEIESP